MNSVYESQPSANHSAITMEEFRQVAPLGSELPVMITPSKHSESLLDAFERLQPQIEASILTVGGVLLRGFDVPCIQDFQGFVRAFGHPLLRYDFGSTPRTAVGGGVYTSTEYPSHQHIPLHNEQAYTREWAMKLWFHCVNAALSGGETPIADSRAIYRAMPAYIRNRFAKGILYVRNYGEFDVPWQQVFNTDCKADVEKYCRRNGIQWEWKKGNVLRTQQVCQGIERHPRSGETVWFNQAHLFHISSQPPEVRETLEDLLGIENVPRNVYYADGSVIPDTIFDEVRNVLAQQTVVFAWQVGDVLMLDNMLAAHGRTPFKGERKVVVAMAEPHSNLNGFK